jgi:hypothetical protein
MFSGTPPLYEAESDIDFLKYITWNTPKEEDALTNSTGQITS